MAKHLSQLLGQAEDSVKEALTKLEELSGFPAEDNRLLSEIRSRLRAKLPELGLDPDDTTPQELYYAAQSRFEQDSHIFHHIIGASPSMSADLLNKRLIQLIKLLDLPDDAWVLRRSAAKNMLRKHQPKKLMKHLCYRSVESMLKREDIDELYAALPVLESSGWLKAFWRQCAGLAPSDFEVRQISFLAMPAKKWAAADSLQSAAPVQLLGAVAFWPLASGRGQPAISTFLVALEATESLRLDSLALMSHQLEPNFGKRLVRQLSGSASHPAGIASLPVSWRSLLHSYSHLPNYANPILHEAYLQDVSTKKASLAKIVATLHPAFRWWADTDHLGALAKKMPISLNINDVAHNFRAGRSYSKKTYSALGHAVWDELIARYIVHPGVEKNILQQLHPNQTADDYNPAVEFVQNPHKEFQFS